MQNASRIRWARVTWWLGLFMTLFALAFVGLGMYSAVLRYRTVWFVLPADSSVLAVIPNQLLVVAYWYSESHLFLPLLFLVLLSTIVAFVLVRRERDMPWLRILVFIAGSLIVLTYTAAVYLLTHWADTIFANRDPQFQRVREVLLSSRAMFVSVRLGEQLIGSAILFACWFVPSLFGSITARLLARDTNDLRPR